MPAPLQSMADAIRVLSMDAVEQAASGHPGMPMGMADVATVLWSKFLKFDASAPDWADRDRFVLSAGHGSMLLYSLLHLTGFKAMTLEQIKNFRQWGSNTAGHPEYGHTPGVETTTGPLGQGLATSVGMAMAERHLAARFGADLVDHRTWVICGDGCLMEGVSHEAISLAGRLKLAKLTLLWDDNDVTIDGASILSMRPSRIQTTRSETLSILKSWVAEMMVTPRSPLILCSRAMISSPVEESRLPVGSSARMIRGRAAKARARATRCCSPPDSWEG